MDQHIHYKALGRKYGIDGEVSSTYTFISNLTFGILLAADVGGEYKMDSSNLGFEIQVIA